jgi:hypothetical protein
MAATFLQHPDGLESARWADVLARGWDPARAWGVRDRGRWVATLRTEQRLLMVPGVGGATVDLAVDALTNVTVAATHRRQGLVSRMLSASLLRAARERGDTVSILIAPNGRSTAASATPREAVGRLRAASLAALATCSGDLTRVRGVERDDFGELARGDSGLLPPFGTLEVSHLATTGDAADRDLWAYLTGVDLIDAVNLSNRPVDEPARWLLRDARTLVMTHRVDFMWLRLLDVAAALSPRRDAAPGEVVLEVTDEDHGRIAAGRLRLVADGDAVDCRLTDRPADVQITQRALASINLGGFRLRELAFAYGVTERTPGALARVDLMFSVPLAPWNATWF